jgi:hypothetical protein
VLLEDDWAGGCFAHLEIRWGREEAASLGFRTRFSANLG